MPKAAKHVIKDVKFVECPYCQSGLENQFKMLHWKHLEKFHSKTIEDVLIEFPGIPTMTLEESRRRKENATISSVTAKKTYNDTKEIRYIYCASIMIVRNNTSNKQACRNCISDGKENPDGRTKKEAYDKRAKVLQERYGKGITNPNHVPGAKNKIQQTCEERYGGRGFASKELADKTRITIKNRYGETNIMKTENGRKRFKELLSLKYGEKIENPMQILEVAKKVSEALRGKPSRLKGRNYEEIHGEEKAKELIENRRISGVKSYLKSPNSTEDQLILFNLIHELFPTAKLEYCVIGETDEYGKFGYALDIAIPDYKICIEFDGWRHDLENTKEHDKTRDDVLNDFGWKTIRFRNSIIDKNELIEKIKSFM